MRGLRRRLVVASAVLLCSGGLLVLGRARATAYEARPIPTEKGGYTNDTFVEEWGRFQTRNLVEGYAKHGRHSAAWDEAAERYAKAWVRWLCWHSDAESPEQLAEEGKTLSAAGCDDPMMQYLYGLAIHEQGDAAGAEQLFRQALEGFEGSTYPRVHAAYAALRVANICDLGAGARKREAERYQGLAERRMAESMTDGSFAEGEQRVELYVLDEMRDSLPTDRLEALYRRLEGNQRVDPYVRDVLGGWVYTDLAWEARGIGWADTVTEEGWKGFARNLAIARGLLTKAWKAYPQYPHAPTAMIRIAMAGQAGRGETERMWFDRAVAAHMDYREAYDALIKAMRPRWGGSHEAIYAFGVECANTKRYDTEVPHMLYRCVQAVADDIGPDAGIWEDAETRVRLYAMFEGYEKDAGADDRTGVKSEHAAVAWRAGDYGVARRLMEDLGDRIDGRPFYNDFGLNVRWAKGETYAFTGSHGKELLEAESLARQGRKREAYGVYAAVAPEADERSTEFVRHRGEMLRLEAALAEGGWVALKPEDSFAGWLRLGDWRAEPDGSLTGVAGGPLWIWCDADFGLRMELRGEVEFVEAPGGTPDAVIGTRCVRPPRGDGATVQLLRGQNKVRLSHDMRDYEAVTKAAKVEKVNTFLVQVWDETVNVFVNDQTVVQKEQIRLYYPDERRIIGFGVSDCSPGVTLRFRKLEARKLTERL